MANILEEVFRAIGYMSPVTWLQLATGHREVAKRSADLLGPSAAAILGVVGGGGTTGGKVAAGLPSNLGRFMSLRDGRRNGGGLPSTETILGGAPLGEDAFMTEIERARRRRELQRLLEALKLEPGNQRAYTA